MAYASLQARPSLPGRLAGHPAEALRADSRIAGLIAIGQSRRTIALIAWNLQAQLSTVALLSMLALVSAWTALAVMVAWSAVSAIVYVHGRRRGLPDVFSRQVPDDAHRGSQALLSCGQALLGGLQPFVYTRTLCRVLETPANCLRSRMSRIAVLALGLTLFGVTAAHHLLQKAGYEDRRLLHYSLVGAVLHASYRILLSGIVISFALRLSDSFLA